jgi:hypothetical protein
MIYAKSIFLHVFGHQEAVSGHDLQKVQNSSCVRKLEVVSRQNLQKVYFSTCVWTDGFPVRSDVIESWLSLLCSDMVLTCPDAAA